MKQKLNIALQLLQAIQDLELSPEEVKVVTEKWLSAYPSVSEQVGDKINALSSVRNIAEEVDKLLHLLASDTAYAPTKEVAPQTEESLVEEDLIIVDEPSLEPEEKPETAEEPEPAEEPKPNAEEPPPATEPKPAKGISKNGKRLGRPPRKNLPPATVEEKTALSKDEPQSKPEPTPKAEEKPLPEPPAEETPPAAETPVAEPAPEPVKEEPVKPEPKEPTKEEIAALQYGKTYELDAVYEVNGFFVRTNRLLEGTAHPIGIIVPYTENDNRGELLVRYCDEHAVIPIRQAAQYAKYRLMPYYGRRWRLKENRDDAKIRNSGMFSVLNVMLKKMGGDELKGSYFDGKSSYIGDKYDDNRKIRYVCDVFYTRSDEEEAP